MKKKKQITLPYNVQPVIPDKVAGVDKFNELNSGDANLSEAKLSSKDKDKLADFVQKTNDMDEIETFIAGLKTRSMHEDLTEDTNFYDKLPRDVQLYLDMFDGPWIDYGETPDGEIYYSDEYDTYTWKTIDEFIADQRYNIRETAKQYKEHPEDFDYSDEFCELLSSTNIDESMKLTEMEHHPNDFTDPRSPWYSGPTATWLEEKDEIEINFDQRLRFYSDDINDWRDDPFSEDFEKYSSYPIEVDGQQVYTLDKYEMVELVEEILDDMGDLGAKDIPGDYRVTGTALIPYEITGVEKYPVYAAKDEWDYDEYAYDIDNVFVDWDMKHARIVDYHIERVN